jgi:hypothetical protein
MREFALFFRPLLPVQERMPGIPLNSGLGGCGIM